MIRKSVTLSGDMSVELEAPPARLAGTVVEAVVPGGLTALDAGTYVAVSALFGLVATVAAFVPARRAMRIDPLQALRFE